TTTAASYRRHRHHDGAGCALREHATGGEQPPDELSVRVSEPEVDADLPCVGIRGRIHAVDRTSEGLPRVRVDLELDGLTRPDIGDLIDLNLARQLQELAPHH